MVDVDDGSIRSDSPKITLHEQRDNVSDQSSNEE